MTRRALLTLFLTLITLYMGAVPVDTLQAIATATHFLRTEGLLRTKATPLILERTPAAYIVGAGHGESDFVLVATDTRMPAVLGYGTRGKGRRPAAMQQLLDDYARCLKLARATKAAKPIEEAPAGPLLTTVRHQEAPYNAHCPYYVYDDGTQSASRCVVGCVATALEQILTYHRRTYTLQDTLHGWQTSHYDIPDVLPRQSVDSRLILDNYDGLEANEASLDAVARLSYWLGVAAQMNWGPGASGAVSRRCVEPLKKAFGLGYVHYADSYRYAPDDWLRMLRAELSAGRPIYYAANTMRLNGHAFVLDGFDAAGMFHVNWGYGGNYDGFFNLSVLYSAEPAYDQTDYGPENGFISNHEAIFIHPDALTPTLPDTLERTGEELQLVSWQLLEAPMTLAYTPMTLTLKNTAPHKLTTPIELFTNLPSDTALIQQGDYVALTQFTLEAGETRTQTVHLRFDEGGERTLRLSPDDIHVVDLGPVSIAPHRNDDLQFGEPAVSFPEAGVAAFTMDVSNGEGAARAGKILTYELGTPDDGGQYGVGSHAHYIYLRAGASMHDSISFRGLTPGTRYQLRVRCPWTVQRTLDFTLPHPDAIALPSTHEAEAARYDLQGRRLDKKPLSGGIYIENKKKILTR